MDNSAQHNLRNIQRGLRTQEATARRQNNRSLKRNLARRLHRISKRALGVPAQEPRLKDLRIKFNQTITICTLNVRGLIAAGKRKDVEPYMTHKHIDIPMMQGAHVGEET